MSRNLIARDLLTSKYRQKILPKKNRGMRGRFEEIVDEYGLDAYRDWLLKPVKKSDRWKQDWSGDDEDDVRQPEVVSRKIKESPEEV